jgi:phosphatidate cytidylyltransferase
MAGDRRLVTAAPKSAGKSSRRFDWKNFGLRAVSATALILAVLLVVFSPVYTHVSWPFHLMIAAAVVLLSLEWGRMSAPHSAWRVAVLVGAAVLAALCLTYFGRFGPAWLIALSGAVLAAMFARSLGERPLDVAFGVVYIAGPCLALTWLRWMPHPIGWTILLFCVTWSADIAAFVVGNALKGPKLSPKLSPNKTWTGFAGGLLAAMLAAIGVATFPHSTVGLGVKAAAMIGLAGGLATMGGDLWESMLKRRFGVKDSGDIIPGHGGLLDRVDGLMFAALAVAGARLIYQTGWTH